MLFWYPREKSKLSDQKYIYIVSGVIESHH